MAEEVHVKISRQRLVFAIAVAVVAIIVYFSYPMLHNIYQYIIYNLFPITKYNYYGTLLEFRSDLKQAQNIQVYPYDDLISKTLLNPFVTNLTIAFQNTSQNNLVAVEGYEIAFKMKTLYLVQGRNITINSEIVNSTEQGVFYNPVIILMPPVLANETIVRVGNYTIIVSAKTPTEFDEATDKVLMVAMGIKV